MLVCFVIVLLQLSTKLYLFPETADRLERQDAVELPANSHVTEPGRDCRELVVERDYKQMGDTEAGRVALSGKLRESSTCSAASSDTESVASSSSFTNFDARHLGTIT